MAKEKLKLYKYPKLIDLYKQFFNIDLDGAHRALIDTTACKEVYFKLLDIV